ncbi:UNVERIFIED_CONTAM: hypothetical protein FKN15_067906 [Acipenser sinensis]
MKKDGIQTRNRKVSSKSKKGKKLSDPSQDGARALSDESGPYCLGTGTLQGHMIPYSQDSHLLSPMHPHPSGLNYGHYPPLQHGPHHGVTNNQTDLSLCFRK